MDQNESFYNEEIREKSGQLFKSMVHVFSNLPCDTLTQLPGLTSERYNILKLMKNKLKSLHEENIDDIDTPELNHTENGQSINEINMNMTSKMKRISFTDNNDDIPPNHPPNNDVYNKIEDRVVDFVDLGDDSETLDASNNTEIIQGDLAAASNEENCDDPYNECVTGNYSKQDECVKEIDSECSVAHGTDVKMEFTNEPNHLSKNDVHNEIEDRDVDFVDLCDDSETLEANYNNDIELQNNDTSNNTEIIQGDNNNDLAAASNEENCDDPYNECVTGNYSKQDECVIENRNVDFVDLGDDSETLDANYNNDIESQNNDTSNNTKIIQGQKNNDLAAAPNEENCDYPYNECVTGNYSKQDECAIEIDSKCSVANGANDKMEFTNELSNIHILPSAKNDNVEAMDTSDDTRNSPLPTFDDDDDDVWNELYNKLEQNEDYLIHYETGFTEKTNLKNVQSNNYLQDVLKQYFEYENFKEGQEKVIQDVLNYKNNCLIIMPAGSGKSLCYQLPAKMSDGVTVVISQSPLLIHDQLEMLKLVDIKAEHFVIRTNNISESVNVPIYEDLQSEHPKIKLLYMQPEKLLNTQCKSILKYLRDKKKISRFVIDDAQFISAFFEIRPAYKELGEALREFQDVPITVLASSISTSVRADIMEKLKIPDGWNEYRISLDVPNFSYNVVQYTEQCFEDVADTISTDYMGKSCIVYCHNVEDTKKMANILEKKGVTAKTYHNEMDDKSRKELYDEWHSDSHFVICATSMFGLGKVKAGVALVVHLGLPDSLESYCQQTGRAGGGAVRCVLYYSPRNFSTYCRKLTKHQKKKQQMDRSDGILNKENQLFELYKFFENKTKCRRLQILEYFGDLQKVECGDTRTLCDNCLQKKNSV